MSTFLIHNALLGASPRDNVGYVFVRDGKAQIQAIGPAPEKYFAMAEEVIDARGAYLIPGLVDSHVHFREPGLSHKATVQSESLAAAAGAITTVFDMPNCNPATTSAGAFEAKMEHAATCGCHTRYAAIPGVVPGAFKELKKIDPSRIPAVKIFLGTSTGAMAAPEGAELEAVMRYCATVGLPVMVHAEDNALIEAATAAAVARYGSADKVPVSLHHEIRSRKACLRSAAAAVELAERFGTRLHLAHVSTAQEVHELLSEGPAKGKLITAETTPLYLDPYLADAAHRTSLHKVNPAIKTPEDAEALRKALSTGAIDTIATDHAPHLLQEKLLPGITAMSGAPSVQFAVPLMLTYLPMFRIVQKMTVGPAEVFGFERNILNEGSVADMSLVRRVPSYEITDEQVVSKCGWTPFAGRTVDYRVERTWVAGETVYRSDGPYTSAPASTLSFRH